MTDEHADADDPVAPLWRSRPFVRFWAGHATSSFGDQISALALPYIAVTVLHVTPAQVGVLTAALWLPNLLALFIGTGVDALRRRQRLLVLANVLQCAAVASVPVLFVTGGLSIGLLDAAALALGFGGVLYGSAYPSFFVRLVHRDQYVAANSLLSTTLGISSVAGPAAGGALIQLISAPFALLIDAGSFLVSAAAIASARARPEPAMSPIPEPYVQRLKLGVAYLRMHRILRASVLASATMNLAALAIQALLVLYATRQLHLTAGQIGLALGVGAVGGLLGATTSASVARAIGVGRAIAIGVALNTLPFIALPIAAGTNFNGFFALSLAEFISAWAIMLFDINNNALRTSVTNDQMRARVSGAYATVNYGVRPLGALVGGTVASVAGTGPTIATAAVLGSVATVWIVASPIAAVRRIADV